MLWEKIIIAVVSALFAWLSYRQGFKVGLWTGRRQNVDREAAAHLLEQLGKDDAFCTTMLKLTTDMHLPTERIRAQYKLDPMFQQKVDLMIKHDMLIVAAAIAEAVKRITKGGEIGREAESGGSSGENRRIITSRV